MAHKNLLTEKNIQKEIEIIFGRKPFKCWKTKKVCYKKEGAEDTKLYEQKRQRIQLSIYFCHFCNSWHLTSH